MDHVSGAQWGSALDLVALSPLCALVGLRFVWNRPSSMMRRHHLHLRTSSSTTNQRKMNPQLRQECRNAWGLHRLAHSSLGTCDETPKHTIMLTIHNSSCVSVSCIKIVLNLGCPLCRPQPSSTVSKRQRVSPPVQSAPTDAATKSRKSAGGGAWTESEDDALRGLVDRYGVGSWALKCRQLGGRRTESALRYRWHFLTSSSRGKSGKGRG